LQYLVLFCASKMTTARVRIAYIPDTDVTTGPPENRAGDVMSTVVSIQGDTIEKFSIPMVSDTNYKYVNDFNTTFAPSNSNLANGRITCTVINPIATTPGGTACNVGIAVYVSAGPGYQLTLPDPWGGDAEPIFADPALDRFEKKGDITAMFGSFFPSIIPTISVVESGMCAPDIVDSVCSLMKRYEDVENGVDIYAAGVGISREVGPASWPSTSWHWWIVALFHMWRGSIMYKIIPAIPTIKTAAAFLAGASFGTYQISNEFRRLEAWRDPQAGDTFHYSLAGRVFAETKVTPWLEVCVPYYNDLIGSEVTPLLAIPGIPASVCFRGTPATYTYSGITGTTVPAPAASIFMAVGDDFTLGRFICCPMIDIGSGEHTIRRKPRSALMCLQKHPRLSALSPDDLSKGKNPEKVRMTAPSRLYSTLESPM